jgi:hypothetical protein
LIEYSSATTYHSIMGAAAMRFPFAVVLFLSLAVGAWSWACADPPAPTKDNAADTREAPHAKRIAALEKSLTGATLVGHFTITGKEPAGPTEERYKFGEVKYLGKNQWLMQAVIHYGQNEVTLPLTLPIKWAGDTPVISIDKMEFPGLGTYSARVMFFEDHYAGIWTGADHGGHLYGRIERAKPASGDATE